MPAVFGVILWYLLCILLDHTGYFIKCMIVCLRARRETNKSVALFTVIAFGAATKLRLMIIRVLLLKSVSPWNSNSDCPVCLSVSCAVCLSLSP